MEYSHFIITQFNLRNFPLSNNNDLSDWVEWTRRRIVLFKEYCLPSVLNQSNKGFEWLLYFDTDTPGEFNDFLNELRAYTFIHTCFCRGIDEFNSNYIDEVKKRTGKKVEWVVTTRIDNDDCLHKQAIRIIQKNLVEKDKFLISLASGYLMNIEDRTLSHYYYPMSPFITLIESARKDIKGVFEKGHTKWDSLRLFVFREIWMEFFNKKSRKSCFILTMPLWIQTVHGDNVSNSFYRGLPVIREKDLRDFSLDFSTKRLSLKTIRKYYNYVVWKRYVKCLIIKILLKR